MRTSIVLVLGLAAGVLGYGWWHVATHATFHMSLNEKTADGKFGNVFNADYTMYSTQLEINSRACTVTGFRG